MPYSQKQTDWEPIVALICVGLLAVLSLFLIYNQQVQDWFRHL